MATEQRQDREIPIAVVNWVRARVHVRLAGNPEEDIEDVVQNTLLGLVQAMRDWDSPIGAWTALAKTIAWHRIIDCQRAQYRKVAATSLGDDDVKVAATSDDIDALIEEEWMQTRAAQLKVDLERAAKGNSLDEELVAILLAKLNDDGCFPSFSPVGAEAA